MKGDIIQIHTFYSTLRKPCDVQTDYILRHVLISTALSHTNRKKVDAQTFPDTKGQENITKFTVRYDLLINTFSEFRPRGTAH